MTSYKTRRIFNRIAIVVCFILLICDFSTAQDSLNYITPVIKLKLFPGIYYFKSRDEIISPLLYKSVSPYAGFEFSYYKNKKLKTFEISINQHRDKSSITQNFGNDLYFYTDMKFAQINLNFLRKLNKSETFDIFFGGGLINSFFYKNHYYILNNSSNYDYFSSLNCSLLISSELGKNSLVSMKCEYPIVSYVLGRIYNNSIPPSKLLVQKEVDFLETVQSGDWLFLNDFVDFKLHISYNYFLSAYFDVTARYSFRYFQYAKPGKLTGCIQSFDLALSYTF